MLLNRHLTSVYVKTRSKQSSEIAKILDEEHEKYKPILLQKPTSRVPTAEPGQLRKQLIQDKKDAMYKQIMKQGISLTKKESKDEIYNKALDQIHRNRSEDARKQPSFELYVSEKFSLADPEPSLSSREDKPTEHISDMPTDLLVVNKVQQPRRKKKPSVLALASREIIREKKFSARQNSLSSCVHVTGHDCGELLWEPNTLFTRIEFETKDTYRLNFEAIWVKVEMQETIRDASELRRIKNMLRDEYPMLVAVFSDCAAADGFSTGDPYKIVSDKVLSQKYQLGPVSSMQPIDLPGFFRLLVSLAEAKYSKGRQKLEPYIFEMGLEYSTSIRLLMQHLRQRVDLKDRNYFRNYFLLFEDVHDIFKAKEGQLRALFNRYRRDVNASGLRYKDFLSLMQEKKQFDVEFTARAVSQMFTLSIGVRVDKARSPQLKFHHFLELIGRIAHYKHQEQLDELLRQDYRVMQDCKLPELIRFDTLIRREKGGTHSKARDLFKAYVLETITSLLMDERNRGRRFSC